jgi:sialate O-acetylesterase
MDWIAKIFCFTVFCCALSVTNTAFCEVKLPRLVSDGMVLQRDTDVKIWGWASSGENIKVNFIGKSYKSKADKNGKWEITLSSMKAGGPYTMEIKGENNSISLKDILVGDVWVCSGQSNMDLTITRVRDRYPDVIETAENPYIRRFLVPMVYDFKTPHQDLQSGKWESANPKSVLNFTATGYFFARALYEKYKVPIGLVHASVGGSPAESWLSEGVLKKFPEHIQTVQKLKDDSYIKSVMDKEQAAINSWYRDVYQLDKGWAKNGKYWFNTDYDASDWPSVNLPTYFANEELGRMNGVVWFGKEIDVPAPMVGKPARIELGAIIDSDHVYINGKLVGTTGYRYPPRKYDVPSDVLKEGKNIIVIRVISNAGEGGFVKGKPYELTAGGQTIDLKGAWQYKVGAVVADPQPSTTFFQYKPLGLYNGMIAPLLNYTIKGVIWYQGESNTGRAFEYHKLFPALIADWRDKRSQGDFPFLYVQLHNFMEPKKQPSESGWAELREAQLETLSVPNTGMAVAIDIGEANDLHPSNKKDVGERLALVARKVAYGEEDIVYSGPIYKSMKIDGNKIILSFTNIGSGLVAKGGGELKHFAIAGKDKKFVWAKAKIEKDKVVVWSEDISKPVAVRYAWADNPEGANLYNKEGLPASPFRTDG